MGACGARLLSAYARLCSARGIFKPFGRRECLPNGLNIPAGGIKVLRAKEVLEAPDHNRAGRSFQLVLPRAIFEVPGR